MLVEQTGPRSHYPLRNSLMFLYKSCLWCRLGALLWVMNSFGLLVSESDGREKLLQWKLVLLFSIMISLSQVNWGTYFKLQSWSGKPIISESALVPHNVAPVHACCWFGSSGSCQSLWSLISPPLPQPGVLAGAPDFPFLISLSRHVLAGSQSVDCCLGFEYLFLIEWDGADVGSCWESLSWLLTGAVAVL